MTKRPTEIPDWQLPPGVSRGTWDYVNLKSIATEYDRFVSGDSLLEFDQRFLEEELSPLGRVVDLGCGTGRALVPLCRLGHSGLAVDLSPHMLAEVRAKAEREGLAIETLEANLVELGAVPDASVDYAICMFSTLGMIRGAEHRLQVLRHARRIVRPGGRLVLHVHNYWLALRDPSGWYRVPLEVAAHALGRGPESGDRYYSYRGVPQMYLHLFRARELRALLRSAGFRVRRWVPLDVARRHALRCPWWLPALRTAGWVVSAE